MSDFRQCVRCGRMDAIPGTALDFEHKCGHGFRCEPIPGLRVFYCQWCVQDRIQEAKISVEKSLPGAYAALMSATGGVPDPTARVANGPAGAVTP